MAFIFRNITLLARRKFVPTSIARATLTANTMCTLCSRFRSMQSHLNVLKCLLWIQRKQKYHSFPVSRFERYLRKQSRTRIPYLSICERFSAHLPPSPSLLRSHTFPDFMQNFKINSRSVRLNVVDLLLFSATLLLLLLLFVVDVVVACRPIFEIVPLFACITFPFRERKQFW